MTKYDFYGVINATKLALDRIYVFKFLQCPELKKLQITNKANGMSLLYFNRTMFQISRIIRYISMSATSYQIDYFPVKIHLSIKFFKMFILHSPYSKAV